MAIEYITFPNKSRGDVWSSGNVNEIKEVVNANADVLQAHASRLSEVEGSISSMKQVVVQDSNLVDVLPNRLNLWPSPVSSLTLTLSVPAGAASNLNEYMLQFTVDGDEFSLTLPSSVRWMEEPEWEDGYTYQVSILNGLAVYAGWEAVSE